MVDHADEPKISDFLKMRFLFLVRRHIEEGKWTVYFATSSGLCEWVRSESRSVGSDSLQPHGHTVHGILQARILESVAFPFSRGSSQSRDKTQISHITGRFFTSSAIREAPGIQEWLAYPFSRGSSQPRNRTEVSCTAGRIFTDWVISHLHFCPQLVATALWGGVLSLTHIMFRVTWFDQGNVSHMPLPNSSFKSHW